MLRKLILIALLLVCASVAFGQTVPPPLTSQRAWISPKSERTTRLAKLHVGFAPEFALPGKVAFECQVTATEPFDETHLVLTIHDPSGTPIHTGEIQVNLSTRDASGIFTWEPAALADGVYSAKFDLHRQSGGELAEAEFGVTLITGIHVQSRLETVRVAIATLRQTLGGLAAAGTTPAYPALHTAIVEDYLPLATSALNSGDWRRADQFATYLHELAETSRLELSLVTPGTSSVFVPASTSATKINVAHGGLEANGEPRFLFGAAHSAEIANPLPVLERYGLHLAVYRVAPQQTLLDAHNVTPFVGPMGTFLDEAQRHDVYAIIDLAPENLPTWAQSPDQISFAGGSFTYDLMDDTSRAILARHIGAVVAAAASHSNVVSVSLARDPALHLRESTVREGLIALAQSRYRDYDMMNRRWRTRYMNFNEVPVDWTSRHPAYLYDLQTYHHELGTQLFAWLATVSRNAAPNLPVQVQFADSAFDKNESATGIDREAILTSMDISGCSASQTMNANGIAIGAPRQAACYALLRSLRPQAPVINTNDRFTLPAGITGRSAYGRVRVMMWEAVIAGLDASAMQLGTPGLGNDGVLSRPELIDGFATANLDINRLAPIVRTLQQTPAPVAIVWSMSSKIFAQGDPYADSALRAYEGCANFGPPVRFISEHECERDGLNGVKVLVIPKALALSDDAFHAIDRYIESGGVTIRQGNAFPYDQQGISRTDTVSVSKRTILMRSEDSARAYLDALDAAYALPGMAPPPRPVNDFDYPIDGVKSRFGVHERVPYLYLVNLRDEPIRVKLAGPYSSGTDLISGNRIEFPEAIDPLTPMILQLDGTVGPAKVAVNAEANAVPSVTLQPIVTEETEVKKPEVKQAAALRHGR